MKKNTRFDTDAPAVLHTKLDRAWLARENRMLDELATELEDLDFDDTNVVSMNRSG